MALVIYSLPCYSIQVMSSAAARKSDKKHEPSEESNKSTAVLLFATAADTTWRMFVPTLGGSLLGLWLDGVWGTEPLLAVAGLALGIAMTAVLVRQQYKEVEKNNVD